MAIIGANTTADIVVVLPADLAERGRLLAELTRVGAVSSMQIVEGARVELELSGHIAHVWQAWEQIKQLTGDDGFGVEPAQLT